MKLQAAWQSSRNKKLGNAGEEAAAAALRRIGVLMVEEIGTPFVVTNRKGTWVKGFWKTKVSGDLRGHTRKGTSVLAEVKTIFDRNLRWSDLDDHQNRALEEHSKYAISLLIWINETGPHVMNWWTLTQSSILFEPGKSITPEQAIDLELREINMAEVL
jgi:hypothetical protein